MPACMTGSVECARRAHGAGSTACLLLGLPARWHIPEMPLPRIQPIAPTWRKEPFDDPEWLFDVKYDGFRALGYLEQSLHALRLDGLERDPVSSRGPIVLFGHRIRCAQRLHLADVDV